MKTIHSFQTYSTGLLKILCLQKHNQEQNLRDEYKKDNPFGSLLNIWDIFYCDNSGVLKKLLNKNTGENINDANNNYLGKERNFDTEIEDSLWQNRKVLAKNLPQSNLSKIINLHKSNKFLDENKLIKDDRNEYFESNLNKVIFNTHFYS
jgi:hypothetical protein